MSASVMCVKCGRQRHTHDKKRHVGSMCHAHVQHDDPLQAELLEVFETLPITYDLHALCKRISTAKAKTTSEHLPATDVCINQFVQCLCTNAKREHNGNTHAWELGESLQWAEAKARISSTRITTHLATEQPPVLLTKSVKVQCYTCSTAEPTIVDHRQNLVPGCWSVVARCCFG